MKNKSYDIKLHKNKPKWESASGKADRRMSQVSKRSLLQRYYQWTLAYYARTQFSVPCRQNISYRLSQIASASTYFSLSGNRQWELSVLLMQGHNTSSPARARGQTAQNNKKKINTQIK